MTLFNGWRLLMIGSVLTQMSRSLYRIIWDRLVVFFGGRLVIGYVVIVRSDSSAAIRLILDPMAANSVSSLIRRISSLQNLPWSLHFLWVSLEMNMVTDGLSKLPSLNDFHLQIFDDIPETIRPLLARDREGPPYRRRC
ncbi:hypothetical protein V6N11_029527 [Hibiscus sabdariffa]|uniref:Uncharacterized protein n=1 Tax=Hibiscus sabdariffa TaxID=183260 RepID=A0ABR2P707_9ROSI